MDTTRVVLAGGFDDAARTRWVRRLLDEIATRESEACCTLVRAVPDTLRPASKKDPVPAPLLPVTPSAQLTPPTLLERRPPCLCCPDAGLVGELARLVSSLASPLASLRASPLASLHAAPLASPRATPRAAPRRAWLIVELPAATLVWTREELLRTLPAPAPRLFTVMVRRPSAANNATGAALWNLPGLADFDVSDEASAATAVRAITQNAARVGDQFSHENKDQHSPMRGVRRAFS